MNMRRILAVGAMALALVLLVRPSFAADGDRMKFINLEEEWNYARHYLANPVKNGQPLSPGEIADLWTKYYRADAGLRALGYDPLPPPGEPLPGPEPDWLNYFSKNPNNLPPDQLQEAWFEFVRKVKEQTGYSLDPDLPLGVNQRAAGNQLGETPAANQLGETPAANQLGETPVDPNAGPVAPYQPPPPGAVDVGAPTVVPPAANPPGGTAVVASPPPGDQGVGSQGAGNQGANNGTNSAANSGEGTSGPNNGTANNGTNSAANAATPPNQGGSGSGGLLKRPVGDMTATAAFAAATALTGCLMQRGFQQADNASQQLTMSQCMALAGVASFTGVAGAAVLSALVSSPLAAIPGVSGLIPLILTYAALEGAGNIYELIDEWLKMNQASQNSANSVNLQAENFLRDTMNGFMNSCNYAAALKLAQYLMQNPTEAAKAPWLSTILPNLVQRAAAQAPIQNLQQQGNAQLLKAALDKATAAGIPANCLPGRVASLAPPPKTTVATNAAPACVPQPVTCHFSIANGTINDYSVAARSKGGQCQFSMPPGSIGQYTNCVCPDHLCIGSNGSIAATVWDYPQKYAYYMGSMVPVTNPTDCTGGSQPATGGFFGRPSMCTGSSGSSASAAPAAPTSVPACNSKSPYLPWGGSGSATITVSGGQACGVGWHDTPGGPGGVTVLDSMSVSSPPSHGTLKPQDQHVIIFTPTPGYKGQDSFTLSMQEHNGGRSATLSVKVSVTIQ